MTSSPIEIAAAMPHATAPAPDAVCAAAIEIARAAAVEVGGAALVGEHLGLESDDDRIVTHFFASADPAYVGWRWAVTVVRAPRSKTVTVDEVVLLPGSGALLAPEWVPWSDRLQAGDLGIGDLLPTAADDERLVPGYADVSPHDQLDDDAVEALVDELWLGRPRVLSLLGREEAARRWHEGDHGPYAPIARAAEMSCATCGFMAPIRGAFGPVFGICANEYAPDDGRVVSFDHGCGAHSEALIVHTEPQSDEPETESDADARAEPVAAIDAPADEAPVEDAPADEAPVDEAPVEDTPAEQAALTADAPPASELDSR